MAQIFLGRYAGVFGLLTLMAADVTPARGQQTLVCQDVQQDYVIKQTRLDTRGLNFLFFEAAKRGCDELVFHFLDLGASVGARDRIGNTGLLHAVHAVRGRPGAR